MTIKIVFGTEGDDSQEDEDTRTIGVSKVTAVRTATTVGIEDKGTATGQRAHITADVVLERGVERLLVGENWCEAWRTAHDLWYYLDGIASVWSEDEVLGAKSKTMLEDIVRVARERYPITRENYERSGVDLANAWYVEPRTGSAEARRAARVYYDHEPTGTDAPDVDHRAVRWEPNLSTPYVNKLEAEIELWVATRIRLPWTSLDTKSYNKSDRTGPRLVAEAVAGIDGVDITKVEAGLVAAAIAKTFDFYPPSITKARSVYHAGAVAARHVVEHFKMHPRIAVEWRAPIAAAFIGTFRATVEDIAYKMNDVEDTAGSKKRKTKVDLSRTPGLSDLLDDWDTVVKAYEVLVQQFTKAAL